MGIRLDTFEDFLRALFDPPAAPTEWREETDFEVAEKKLIDFYVRLFQDSRFLPGRYSTEQLNDGFASMINCNVSIAVSELVWNTRVALTERLRLIEAMPVLYEHYFSTYPDWYATNMWWDAIAYAYHSGTASRENSREEEALQDGMFSALQRILQIDSIDCQAAALHGLGHLHHPDGPGAIESFLTSHPALDEDLREYALAAARGEVL